MALDFALVDDRDDRPVPNAIVTLDTQSWEIEYEGPFARARADGAGRAQVKGVFPVSVYRAADGTYRGRTHLAGWTYRVAAAGFLPVDEPLAVRLGATIEHGSSTPPLVRVRLRPRPPSDTTP
jgi:hypothetical protein